MQRPLLILGLELGLLGGMVMPAVAVQPVSITASDRVEWSKVITNPFDGQIVYDRHTKGDFVLVTSWARSGIRATYTQLRTELAGYQTIWRPAPFYSRHRRWWLGGGYTEEQPIYVRYGVDSVPTSIQFAINGQTFTYQEGPVTPELAAALATAPDRNMLIRLVWQDGPTRDVEIGRGTVAAWKTIFKPE